METFTPPHPSEASQTTIIFSLCTIPSYQSYISPISVAISMLNTAACECGFSGVVIGPTWWPKWRLPWGFTFYFPHQPSAPSHHRISDVKILNSQMWEFMLRATPKLTDIKCPLVNFKMIMLMMMIIIIIIICHDDASDDDAGLIVVD